MKTRVVLVSAFLILSSIASGITRVPVKKELPHVTPVAESRWSGSISMEQRATWEFGSSTTVATAYFYDAIPTLYRETDTTDLDFTDDKGTGTVESHGTLIIAGMTGKSECFGSGQAELHEVVVSEPDKTYSIMAFGPVCRGVHAEDGSPFEETPDISISPQPLLDPNHLVGTTTVTSDMIGIHSTITLKWDLVRGKRDCAVPVNFRQIGAYDAGNGVLHFDYNWESSTGNLADLSKCLFGENVEYDPTDVPFPSPPFPEGLSPGNPTDLNVPASDGSAQDNHSTPGAFANPYQARTLTATQIYRYSCPCHNSGQWETMMGPHRIIRSVSRNANGTWKFTISKTGASATINPLP
jgi:hypothetical protein